MIDCMRQKVGVSRPRVATSTSCTRLDGDTVREPDAGRQVGRQVSTGGTRRAAHHITGSERLCHHLRSEPVIDRARIHITTYTRTLANGTMDYSGPKLQL